MVLIHTDDSQIIKSYEEIISHNSIVWAYRSGTMKRRALALEMHLPDFNKSTSYTLNRCRWRILEGSLDIDGHDKSRPNLTIKQADLEAIYNNSFTRSYIDAIEWAFSMHYDIICNNSLEDQILDIFSLIEDDRDIPSEIISRKAMKALSF